MDCSSAAYDWIAAARMTRKLPDSSPNGSFESSGIVSTMTEADQKREDDVLRRMLATKPKPHKDSKKAQKPRK